MSKSFEFYEFNLKLRNRVRINNGLIFDRNVGILKIQDQDSIGFAEISPLPGLSKEFLENIKNELSTKIFSSPSLKWGIQCANQMSQSDSPRSKIKLCGLIHQLTYVEILEKALNLSNLSYSHAKVKLGYLSLKDTQAVINEICERTNLILRLDANSKYNFKDAVWLAQNIPAERIDYFEDPFQLNGQNDFEKLEEFFKLTGISYAVDSITPPEENLEGLKYIVVKPTVMGQIPTFKNIIYSSAYESELGIYQTATEALKGRTWHQPHGLDTLDFIDNIFNFKKTGPILELPSTEELKLSLDSFLSHTKPTLTGRF